MSDVRATPDFAYTRPGVALDAIRAKDSHRWSAAERRLVALERERERAERERVILEAITTKR